MTYAASPLSEPEDRAGLQDLWREVMVSRSKDGVADWRYGWFFRQNPAGAPTTCVTRHLESQAVVACGSAFPRTTQLRGALHPAGVLCDFAVARSHRTAGAALMVQRRLMDDSLRRFAFIYGSPNPQAEPIFKRLGYQVVAPTAAYARPLRTAGKLASHLPKDLPRGVAVALTRAAGPLLDRALAATDVLGRLRHRLEWQIERPVRADGRFDELWSRARAHYGITGERSAAYLNWRYADFRTAPHSFYAVTNRKSGELVGYVAYHVEDGVVLVGDLFCDQPDAAMAPLLSRFAAAMRRDGHSSIYLVLVAGERFHQILRRAMFVRRPDSQSFIARASSGASPSLAQALADPESWFLVGGELDT